MTNLEGPKTQSPIENPQSSVSSAPYEAPLTKAFDKLTSQVFIFLLAYVILLIGLAVFGAQLADSFRELLYIIPILGITAHVSLRQQKIINTAKETGIDVRAGIVSNSAKVVAISGAKAGSDLPENVRVGVGMAKDNAEVRGVVYGDPTPDVPYSSSLEVLTEIFKQLNQSSQIKLLSSAQNVLDEQGRTNA